ncbi:hypothetical protein ACNAN0_10050 [Agrilactobacillus fermenti]|uniref:hypothetical protein n=1 Tax=Agrilactobacillus fermenti TaxID=2586909 RepID=UPI003A5C1924
MTANEYGPEVQSLLNEVQDKFPVPITVTVTGSASGLLLHDQSQQVVHKDGAIEIKVTDTTNVAYTLSHELLHMLMVARGFSQLQFPLTSGKPQLDEQMGATATALYNSVAHVIIQQEQTKHHLINETVQKEFLDGFYASVPAENPNKNEDNLLIFRMLSLLDVLVFTQGADATLKNTLLLKYPAAFEYAQQLYEVLTAKALDTPFAFRRAVVNLFKKFAELTESLGYVPMNHQQFAILTPIFSQRQLRLALRQVVEVLHTDFTELASKQKAYVAMGKNDGQAAFILHKVDQDTTPETFQHLYETPLQTVLEQEGITYAVR